MSPVPEDPQAATPRRLDEPDDAAGRAVRPGDRRTRIAWRFPLVAAAVGVAFAALGATVGGASGRVGFVIVLLATATGCGLGALYALVTAVVDDLKHRPVPRSRPIAGIALFFLAALLMALIAGAGG